MTNRLSGTACAASITEEDIKRASALIASGVVPTLALCAFGADREAEAYLDAVEHRCKAAGVCVRRLSVTGDAAEGKARFAALCKDPAVHGVLLSLPLGENYRELTAELCMMIPPEKDVDGLSPVSLGRLFAGLPAFASCTAEACLHLLDAAKIELAGRHAVVIGRSAVVGKPLAAMLLARDATVTVCHRKTQDLAAITRQADVLIAAAGCPNLITADFVKPGAVVVDVGTTWDAERGTLVGDVDESVMKIAEVSPVYGGVGAITSALLTAHVLTAAET